MFGSVSPLSIDLCDGMDWLMLGQLRNVFRLRRDGRVPRNRLTESVSTCWL